MTEKTNKKETFIDNLRAIAITVVVFGHSIILYSHSWGIYKTEVTSPFFDILKTIIDTFQMPLYFSISGYCFCHTVKEKYLLEIIKEKVLRLIVPFVSFGLLWLLPVRLF